VPIVLQNVEHWEKHFASPAHFDLWWMNQAELDLGHFYFVIDKGLKVLFFGLFSVDPFPPSLGNFSANALANI